MELSSQRGRAGGSLTAAASAGAMGLLLCLDVGVGVAYPGLGLPPLVAGAGVAVAVVLAGRHQVAAAWGAAAVSLVATLGAGGPSATSIPLDSSRALPGMAEVAGLAFLLCLALRSLRARAAAGVVAIIGAALVGVVGRGGDDGYQPLVVLAVALAVSVAAGAGVYLRWIDHDRRLGIDDARESERLAIARELHDVVAHHVTGIVVQAQAAQAVWEDRPAAARSAIEQIEAAGAEALRSMRRLVETLRDGDTPLTPIGATDELERLAARSTELGLPVRLHLDGLPDDLRSDVVASVNRIVTEAITNAQRHAAGATGVDVTVERRGARLSVQVHDDGHPIGLGRGRGDGYGLIGMTERAAAMGGTLRAGPAEDRGWLVEADLPLART